MLRFIILFASAILTFSKSIGKCPLADEIYPCKCYAEFEEVGCTNLQVSSLKQIFNNVDREIELHRLFIDSTEIKQLESQIFGKFSFSEVSLFDNKQLRSIHENAFESTANKIEDLRIAGSELYGDEIGLFSAIAKMSNLKRLLLVENKLQKVASFGAQPQLYLIEMHENQINVIDDFAFKHLSNLEMLTLSRNNLTVVTEHMLAFNSPSNVSLTVDVSANFLTADSFHVNSLAHSTIKRPVRLFIGGNPLKTLKQEIFKPLLDGHPENEIHFNHYPFGEEVKHFDCSGDEKWVLESDYSKRIIGFAC
ncbi:slit-like protein 2 [Leptotrombidium deliense]|uniref:Slit-like protein 2 n=1 Tax=Leptotrombidium deliense TaxID=299467 RepID=A0A443S8Q4_9ACAR|nr:slit-like protein 2 [Leptotrombidium deliense]